MKNTTLFLFTCTAAALTSCTSLQTSPLRMSSPSLEMQGGDASSRSSNSEKTPTLVLNGERHDSTPGEDYAFDWPLDDARISRGFSLGGKRAHWGVDLANSKGTPILSSERGTVIYTGNGFHGYGNLIVIEHGGEWATLYSHLSKIEVKEGEKVIRGQRIGQMGRTGHASGNHLHFEIRHDRQPVNPLAYLPQGLPAR